jgi:SAM-dependent methyltransferase
MTELISCLCTQKQLESESFVKWINLLVPGRVDSNGKLNQLHRKLWELAYVTQALDERGMLQTGKKGLAFAVGQEPLPAYFASRGCEIVATDLGADEANQKGWVETNQHAASVESLQRPDLCDRDLFRSRVKFRPVDMNQIPTDLRDFDFCWSTCSFEHLGSIGRGQRFILNMLDVLKPGGIGVHTTEYNVYSNTKTVAFGNTVIFRRRDIEAIVKSVQAMGHKVHLEIDVGDQPADNFIDLPPYASNPHLKLQLASFVTTSVGLIIQKNPDPNVSNGGLHHVRSHMGDMVRQSSDYAYRKAHATYHRARNLASKVKRKVVR